MHTTHSDYIFFGRKPDNVASFCLEKRIATATQSPYPFAYARTALKYGLKSLQIQKGDHILIPEFICVSLLDSFNELGIAAQYYPVTINLQPDWQALDQLVTRSTKALLVVHYFGQPQLIEDCLSFCSNHSLLLIEDNAHGYGGAINGKLLGTLGDIGISAPRKSFAIPNGAFLYSKQQTDIDFSNLEFHSPERFSLRNQLKTFVKKNYLINSIIQRRKNIYESRRRLEPAPSYDTQDSFRDPHLNRDYGMDMEATVYLERENIEEIKRKRQQIYTIWLEWSSRNNLQPVFKELHKDALPLVFPAYTQSERQAHNLFTRGHRAGIDIHSWPTLPQIIANKSNSNGMTIWKRLICLPIHQEMDIGTLKKRIQRV